MRYFILASLSFLTCSHLIGANTDQKTPPQNINQAQPYPPQQEEQEGEVADNANEYNLYDRQQNKRDQQQRQQYFYYQNQNQNYQTPNAAPNAPQYSRKKTLQNQYFDPKNE